MSRAKASTLAPSARALAFDAISRAHANARQTWFGSRPYSPCLTTDLLHDQRAINSWPERQPFGWIMAETATFIVRAGSSWDPNERVISRCLTCTVERPVRNLPEACPDCLSPRSYDHGPQVLCRGGRMFAEAYRGIPIQFFAWDGRALESLPHEIAFDERVTQLGSVRL